MPRFPLPLFAIFVGCAPAAPDCAPLIGNIDVASHAIADAQVRSGLRELWRAGGLAEGEELAMPAHVAVSEAGQVAIVDWELGEVVVVAPDGEWLGSWMPSGSGPGEVMMPAAARWAGDTLVAFDFGQMKLTARRDGRLAVGDVRLMSAALNRVAAGGVVNFVGMRPGGGLVVQGGYEADGDSLRLHTLLVDADGDADTLQTSRTTPLLPDQTAHTAPFTVTPWVAVAPDGRIATAGHGASYRILVRDPSAAPRLQICADLTAGPADDAERYVSEPPADLRAALDAAPVPVALAAHGRIFFGASGRLWVQRERPRGHGSTDRMFGRPGGIWDGWNRDGDHDFAVAMPPGVRLVGARGDTLYAFVIGEYDETTLVAYLLEE